MAHSKGGAEVRRFIQELPGQLERRVLLGAGRAGGNVIADEIRDNTTSEDVKAGVKVKVNARDGTITTRIQSLGKGKYLAIWEEYGTDEHEIVARKAGALAIGDKFFARVHHPGARAHPVWRPALDTKATAAVAAAQAHINKKVTKAGIVGTDEQEDGE